MTIFYTIIICFGLFVFIIVAITSNSLKASNHWSHPFDDLQFPPDEFYALVIEILQKREIPNITFSETTYLEAGILSGLRKYLRVSRGEYTFDICAAPFGTGYFVSWWLTEYPNLRRRIIMHFPWIGKELKAALIAKTYYQMDTETMFRDSVHSAVLKAVEEISSKKGTRPLSELERSISNRFQL